MRVLFLVLLSVVLCGGVQGSYKLKRYAQDPLKSWHYTLSNGLQVYLTENHEKPVFYSEIVVRAGSSSDPAESTGIAHYLEHMLFKGTDKFGTKDFTKEKVHLERITELYEKHFSSSDADERTKIMAEISRESAAAAKYAIPNEFDRMYQELGGSKVNAHTSNEETVYKVECPANALEKWCAIESERFRNPVFRLFQTEIEAVYEEKNGSLDRKESALYEAFLAGVYKNHPYGQQTTLGTVEHLKSPSIKRMYEFYNTYYVPNNMAIIISGDIQPQEAIKHISKYFSKWQRREMPEEKSWEEMAFVNEEVVNVDFPGEEQLMMGFRSVPESHPDTYALQLMDMILDNSQAGLINLNLNQTLKVKRAGCYPMTFRDYAHQVFYAIPAKGQSLAEAKDLLLKEMSKVKKGEFDESLIPAIIADFSKTIQQRLESNSGRVSTLRDLFISRRSLNDYSAYLARMKKLNKQDVVRVAQKYLGDNYLVAYRHNRQITKVKMEKPKFEKVKAATAFTSLFTENIKTIKLKKKEARFVNFDKDLSQEVLGENFTYFHVENPVNKLFSLQMKIPFGKQRDQFLPIVSGLLQQASIPGMSAAEIQKKFYSLAADFAVSVGTNETSITLQGLDSNFTESFELLNKLLNSFTLDQGKIDKYIAQALDSREKRLQEPKQLARALNYLSRYEDESPYINELNKEALLEVHFDDLRNSFTSLLKYEMRLSYTGSLDAANVKRVTEKLLSVKRQKAPKAKELLIKSYKNPRINFVDFDTVQTRIRMEFPGEFYNLENHVEYQFFNEYFDGSLGSIVFQEIRETRALAYSAWSVFYPRENKNQQNVMIASLACQADKTIEAMEVFHDIVFNTPLLQKRFDVAKSALLRKMESANVGFRERSAVVQKWQELGLVNEDPRVKRFERIKNMTMADVKKFVDEKIKGNKFVISILGDKKRIDMEKLKQFGEIREVAKKELFSK
ncbi:MAG: insulinase family protein [Lentisphaeraceae bacterium]|nr:insulinase family protein [Lentisphaeraceae bacterium]